MKHLLQINVLVAIVSTFGIGCGSSGVGLSDGSVVTPEIQAVIDLHKLGKSYQNFFDRQNRSPSSWSDVESAGLEPDAIQRLQSENYNVTWDIDLKSGLSMSKTLLAHSSSSAARLMLDGSISGVSEEIISQAQEAMRSQASNQNSQSTQAIANNPAPKLTQPPNPSSPYEQALYDYINEYDTWLDLLGKIKDLSSGQRLYSSLRGLDSKFDDIAERLIEHGDGKGNLTIPPKYQKAIDERTAALRAVETQLQALPEFEQININLTREFKTRGVCGPPRVKVKLNEFVMQWAAKNFPDGVPNSSVNSNSSSFENSSQSEPVVPKVFQVADKVDVLWGGKWYSATVLKVEKDRYFVHYDEFDSNYDTWVQSINVSAPGEHAELSPPQSLAKQNSSSDLPANVLNELPAEMLKNLPADQLPKELAEQLVKGQATRDTRPRSQSSFKKGDKAEVYWGSTWYPATVLKIEGQRFFIHYDGYNDNWDEWVDNKKIRIPQKTK